MNQLLACRLSLPLIWGSKASSRASLLLQNFTGHVLHTSFRKWEVLTRASIWAEHAQQHGLSENLEWQMSRQEALSKQMSALQVHAEEKKWAADVMAKQVVKGTEENSRMKVIIEEMQVRQRRGVAWEASVWRDVRD